MKAIVIREFGGPDKLEAADVPEPQPAAGEIVVKVAYAGVGFVDTLIRAGRFDFFKPPIVPGIEVSGHVHAVGEGVAEFAIGQKVAALLTDFTAGGMGGYAEFARAKAALSLSLGPEDDLAGAAAAMVNGATAFMAMERISRGACVAINGASGGLGQNLLVAAATAGAGRIVAISGKPDRRDALLRAGATEVLDPDEFAAQAPALDAAFDTVGGKARLDLVKALKAGGRLVILGNASNTDLPLSGDDIWLRSLEIEGLTTGGLSHLDPQRITSAARAALTSAAGMLPPPSIVTLEEAQSTHLALEGRQGSGKFVLKAS